MTNGKHLIATVLLCSACSTMPALGQGVPVVDAQSFSERLRAFLNLERDEDTQVEKANNRADLKDFQNQQLESLDTMISAFSSVPTFQNEFINGGGEEYPGIEHVYGPVANVGSSVMFGDAKESVEQFIVRGAAATYSSSGVQRAGLSPLQWRCLVQALVWQESRFQVAAQSHVGAYGLTQIMPGTAQDLGIYPDYRSDPYIQVTGGARYLSQQLARFDGNIVFALAAYNAGPGNVQKYGGVPPFEETQNYVRLIPQKYNSYLQSIGGAEALGTIDPAEHALASASLMSWGSMHYSEFQLATARQALLRVRALVEQIGESENVTDSYNLNTAIRAEIILILSARMRTKAARTQASYAQVAARLTAQRQAMTFFDYTPEFN